MSAIEIEHKRVMEEGSSKEIMKHAVALAYGLLDLLQDWGDNMERRNDMNSMIKIGRAIHMEHHHYEFELVVIGMCGDADAENNNSMFFSEDENGRKHLEWIVFLLDEYNKIPSGYDTEKKLVDAAIAVIQVKYPDLEYGEIKDTLSDLVGYDSTCDNQFLAALYGYELYYYDLNGKKFHATITIE